MSFVIPNKKCSIMLTLQKCKKYNFIADRFLSMFLRITPTLSDASQPEYFVLKKYLKGNFPESGGLMYLWWLEDNLFFNDNVLDEIADPVLRMIIEIQRPVGQMLLMPRKLDNKDEFCSESLYC